MPASRWRYEGDLVESEIKANILLVDDRPDNLLALETILSDLGQNLIRATSAREALRFLLAEDVALILLDVQMPGVDGFEFAELVRQRERTQQAPIIFVTAISDDEQYIFKGYSLGAVDYLTKPIEPEILRSKVRFFIKLFCQNEEIKKQASLVAESNARLDSLNTDLERRVAERTAELESEIAVRKQSEARLAIEHGITRALSEAANLESAAPIILRTFCDFLNVEICTLWLLDGTETELFCSKIETSGPEEDVAAFVAACRERNFIKGVGLPGHVWNLNGPVWLENDFSGPEYPRAKIAKTIGLVTAVGFPIKIGGKFLGVIEFFTRHELKSEQLLLNMLEVIGSEIGQFVQRKRVEADREELLVREKSLRSRAENASRLKDEFLATVSHELRTPLNSILGWGQILREGKLTAKEQKMALDTIHRNAKSQAQLIDDLLDTSRLITGNLRLELEPTEVVPLIRSAIDVLRPAAEAKGISIATEFPSDIASIICDPRRLQQMVSNLLTNAVKFTPRRGAITVGLEHDDDAVQIIVSDTGQGIPAEFLPFVFDRFRQADGSSTRANEGVGLGLAIVRHLAELHGGRTSVTSDGLGKGSRFVIALPLNLSLNAKTEKAVGDTNGSQLAADAMRLKGVRVLLVDDDADARQRISLAISLAGAEVSATSSVARAVLQIRKFRPDILIADLGMPGEDGHSLINKIRAQQPVGEAIIPAIALTATARPEDGERALSAGFQIHIAKPIDIELLTQSIADLVQTGVASEAEGM